MSDLAKFRVGDEVMWQDPNDPEDAPRRGRIIDVYSLRGSQAYHVRWWDELGGVDGARPEDLSLTD